MSAPARKDRVAAWLLTGPVGRVAAFVGDLAAALGRAAAKAVRDRSS